MYFLPGNSSAEAVSCLPGHESQGHRYFSNICAHYSKNLCSEFGKWGSYCAWIMNLNARVVTRLDAGWCMDRGENKQKPYKLKTSSPKGNDRSPESNVPRSFQKTYKWAMETKGPKSNSSELLCLSWLPATLMMIWSKLTELAWKHHFPIISLWEIF